MANIKSSAKRAEIAQVRTLRNRKIKAGVKNSIKKFEVAISSEDKDLITNSYREAVKKIDTAVSKGIFHKNTAARKKSILSRKLNAM